MIWGFPGIVNRTFPIKFDWVRFQSIFINFHWLYCQWLLFNNDFRYIWTTSYVLIDWVGGPDGKIFGTRSGRTDRAQYVLTESQIFSRPARPYSVNKHFIIWPLTVENFENSVWTQIGRDYIRSDGCTRGTIACKFLQQKFVIYFFSLNKKLTIHSKNKTMVSFLFFNCNSCFKKPTECWHKAVKYMSKPSKT